MALITEIQTTSDSGNIFIDSLTFDQAYVPGTVITYILQGNAGDTGAFGGAVWAAEGRRAAFNLALQSWAAVANVVFQEASGSYVAGSTAYDWVERFSTLSGSILGQHELPSTGTIFGDYNRSDSSFTAPYLQQGGYGAVTFVHEIGHGLGLLHPHNDQGDPWDDPAFPGVNSSSSSVGDFGLNQGIYTTMTYNDGIVEVGLSPSDAYGWQWGPMAFDIAAVQRLYGANMATNAGNTVFTLPQSNVAQTAWKCIWDGGGTDTIAAGSTNFACTIDLRAATLQNGEGGGGYVSRIAGVLGGFTIANGAVIENATGGNGNDWLHGNAANNILNGGQGFDTVDFAGVAEGVTINLAAGTAIGDGTDTLVSIENARGGNGDDTLIAGNGMMGTLGAMPLVLYNPGYMGNFVDIDLDYRFAPTSDPSVSAGAGMSTANVTSYGGLYTFSFYVANPGTVIIDVDNTWNTDTLVMVVDSFGNQLGTGTDTPTLDPGSANTKDGYLSVNVAQGNQRVTVSVWSSSLTMTPDRHFDLHISLVTNRLATGTQLIGSRLDGGNGNDVLIGGPGADVLVGGSGNDIYRNVGADDIIVEEINADIDVIEVSQSTYLNIPRIEGILLKEGTGDLFAVGDQSSNILIGNEGANLLIAGDGFDQLTGNDGADQLYGEGNDDTLDGGDGDDLLVGGSGDDILRGGSGADLMYGGEGSDTYYVTDAGDIVFDDSPYGYDTVYSTLSTYLWEGVEVLNLSGAAGDVYAVGNSLANVITGNGGANLILGGAGFDTIYGSGGNDQIYGEGDVDLIAGGSGIDYIVGGSGNDILEGNGDADAIYGGDGDDTLNADDRVWRDPYAGASVPLRPAEASFATDLLVGGDGNDTLYANSGLGDYDILNGGAGNDTYYVDTPDDIIYEGAGEGTDTVYAGITGGGYYLWANVENCTLTDTTPFAAGNELNNVLTGSASDNWLLGNGGNDTLNGKGGNDVLFGDRLGDPAGNDTFVFDGVVGQDVIGDFHHGEDNIRLVSGYTSFEQVQAAFHQNGADGAIDLGGGNFIVLQGVTMSTLTASDFIFG